MLVHRCCNNILLLNLNPHEICAVCGVAAAGSSVALWRAFFSDAHQLGPLDSAGVGVGRDRVVSLTVVFMILLF